MAAGIVYDDQVILNDYPCDIKSIVRYRGGFTVNSEYIEKYKGYRLPPFAPLEVNFTLREVDFVIGMLDKVPSTWDLDSHYVINAFSYYSTLLEEGATATAVRKANEVSWTGLNALRYYDANGTETAFAWYADVLTSPNMRKDLVGYYNQCTFIW